MRAARSATWVVLLGALSLALLAGAPAMAQDRFALVIGNSRYATIDTLQSPARDATRLSQSLEANGFRVKLLIDAPLDETVQSIARFGQLLRRSDDGATALFYFAGHGVQSLGANYLLPADIDLGDAADLEFLAIGLDRLLRQMASVRDRTKIVILDASHATPYPALPDMSDIGLAELPRPKGMFLVTSTQPGTLNFDAASGTSLFSTRLIETLSTPAKPLDSLFQDISQAVQAHSDGQQDPWIFNGLADDFYLGPLPDPANNATDADKSWAEAQASRDAVKIVLFLQTHPDSVHIPTARALLSEVLLAAVPATEPSAVSAGSNSVTGQSGGRSAGNSPLPAPLADPLADPLAELNLFEQAIMTNAPEDYRRYLDTFPSGTYADLARLTLNNLTALTPAPEPEPEPDLATLDIPAFTKLTAMYPPIEGLPAEIWQNVPCSTCHNWTPEALCTQGQRYQATTIAQGSKDHPFGGIFQGKLKDWTVDSGAKRNGCIEADRERFSKLV